MATWTADQLEFIRASAGAVVALAGPGSGKTSCVVEKVFLLAQQPGTRIVAATFTADAAEEMRHRLERKFGTAIPDTITIGTWHSLALRHRKAHGHSCRHLTPKDQIRILRRVFDAAHVPFERAMIEFEEIKCSMISDYSRVEQVWFRDYQETLEHTRSIDLYDVMRDSALKMQSGELPLLDCTHLVIDEAQDNDEIQFFIADLHAAGGIRTTMVGDDDQAVYEWRRARGYSGIDAFAKKHNAKVVTMGENFRSRENIVLCADELIRNNKGFRIDKNFVARRGAGGVVRVASTPSHRTAAAEFIVPSLEPLLSPAPEGKAYKYQVPTGSVAILARTNRLLTEVDAALTSAFIKHHRNKGSIWDEEPAAMLQTILAMLVTFDPLGLDCVLDVGGISPKSAIGDITRLYKNRVHEFFEGDASFEDLPGNIAPQAKAISARLARLRSSVEQRHYTAAIHGAAAMVKRVYISEETERALAQDQSVAASVSKRDQRFLSILESVASALARMKGTILDRLNKVSRLREETPEHSVALLTFHAAKGLEFDTVYLFGVDQNVIPGDSEVRAERRLLYVACTRAKNTLVITHTKGKASSFLREITPRPTTV